MTWSTAEEGFSVKNRFRDSNRQVREVSVIVCESVELL